MRDFLSPAPKRHSGRKNRQKPAKTAFTPTLPPHEMNPTSATGSTNSIFSRSGNSATGSLNPEFRFAYRLSSAGGGAPGEYEALDHHADNFEQGLRVIDAHFYMTTSFSSGDELPLNGETVGIRDLAFFYGSNLQPSRLRPELVYLGYRRQASAPGAEPHLSRHQRWRTSRSFGQSACDRIPSRPCRRLWSDVLFRKP